MEEKSRPIHRSGHVRQKFLEIQTLILVSIVYFLIVPLFVLIGRRRFRRIMGSEKNSFWSSKKETDTSPDGMKQMG